MNEQEFHPGSVPVAVVARVYGKDASWVRAGSISTSRQNDCTRKPDISGEENDDEK